MGTTHAELVETGDKRDGSGRRLTTAERRSELVAAYRRSGLTMAAFARREGLRYSTFAGWVLQGGWRRAPAVRFAQVQLPSVPPVTPAGLEVRLPDGTLLRGGRAAALAELVRALRG
ncbi:MAG: IS66 family insertion sequence element accessory protein TnpA [Verrucomicrobiota bacterium]